MGNVDSFVTHLWQAGNTLAVAVLIWRFGRWSGQVDQRLTEIEARLDRRTRER